MTTVFEDAVSSAADLCKGRVLSDLALREQARRTFGHFYDAFDACLPDKRAAKALPYIVVLERYLKALDTVVKSDLESLMELRPDIGARVSEEASRIVYDCRTLHKNVGRQVQALRNRLVHHQHASTRNRREIVEIHKATGKKLAELNKRLEEELRRGKWLLRMKMALPAILLSITPCHADACLKGVSSGLGPFGNQSRFTANVSLSAESKKGRLRIEASYDTEPGSSVMQNNNVQLGPGGNPNAISSDAHGDPANEPWQPLHKEKPPTRHEACREVSATDCQGF